MPHRVAIHIHVFQNLHCYHLGRGVEGRLREDGIAGEIDGCLCALGELLWPQVEEEVLNHLERVPIRVLTAVAVALTGTVEELVGATTR